MHIILPDVPNLMYCRDAYVPRLCLQIELKSAKRDRAPCLEARSANFRARAGERVARASESQVHSMRSERL